ncbi:hypothetical protein ABW20_dc0104436 [Dactylellina cionopaga]|nr:hypothetical protein ABW20_dc0104436 [Dactylellina cionopaga]
MHSGTGPDGVEDYVGATNRRRVSGTAEPYHIEGPSMGETWEWLKSPLLNFYGLGLGYAQWAADKSTRRYPKGRKVSKRESSDGEAKNKKNND